MRDQAIFFIGQYSGGGGGSGQDNDGGTHNKAADVLTRLAEVIRKLSGTGGDNLEALLDLKHILMESDISPFEVNHSGLIKALLNFMALDEEGMVPRNDRLRAFLHVFADLPIDEK